MVDPKSAMASTNALVTVLVFVGSQLSPSVMVRRAVKKELKVAAILKENGSIITPEDWQKIIKLRKEARRAKLAIPGTKWKDVFRQPIKLIIRAREYHSATDECLFEARVASARAVYEEALASAGQNNDDDPDPQPEPQTPAGDGPHVTELRDVDGSPPYSYNSTNMTVDDTLTTYFDNVAVLTGTSARITLHFGVADVPVTINLQEQLIDAPVSGYIVLFGCARLIPCSDDPSRASEIVVGRYNQGYELEFFEVYWSYPPSDHAADDDRVSLASLEATYGGDRETIYMFDEDEKLEIQEMLRRRREDVARVRD